MFSGFINEENPDITKNFINYINTPNNYIADRMFYGCTNLKKVIFPKYFAITSANSMFEKCTSLEKFSAVNFYHTKKETNFVNANRMFKDCTSMRWFKTYNKIAECENIFENCKDLLVCDASKAFTQGTETFNSTYDYFLMIDKYEKGLIDDPFADD